MKYEKEDEVGRTFSAKEICEKYEKAKAARSNWESLWEECAYYILPNKEDIISERTKGEKHGTYLLDNTAMQSNEFLAGALHGMLTSPTNIFFDLTTGDYQIDQMDDVRRWLQDAVRKMLNVLNESNFQTEIHEVYLDLGCFGTAPMSIEEDEKTVIRFGARNVKELYIFESNKGVVDECIRHWKWTAKQIVQEYGDDNVGKLVHEAWEKDPQKEFTMLQYIYPKPKYNKKFRLPWISQTICYEDKYEHKAKGFNEFPYVVPRWSKLAGEEYGRSPGMTALPEAKTINKMTETIIIAAQKQIDPPLQAPDEGFVLPLKTYPGGVSYYRKGMQDRVEPIFNKEIRLDFGEQQMDKHRNRIREAFYVDQLQLTNGPQMTATEVNQRTEERMRLLGPMLGRQETELLKPLIDRIFSIMLRKGMFLPIPQALAGRNLGVKYSSVVTRAQRATEAQAIARAVATLAPFYNSDPTIMDNFSGDDTTRYVAGMYGLPAEMLRDKKEVDKIRAQRQQAQNQMIQQQQQQHEADMAVKAGQAAQGMGQMKGAQGGA